METYYKSWILKSVSDKSYLIKYICDGRSCQFYISDMTGIWKENLDESDIVKRAQVSFSSLINLLCLD